MSDQSLIQLKRDIASSIPDFEAKATKAFAEIIAELGKTTSAIASKGPDYIPSVDGSSLSSLDQATIDHLKQTGTFIVRGVVPRVEADQWRNDLRTFIDANRSNVEGTPADNPQYFQIFYTKPQVAARAHKGVLDVQTWCNKLYSHSSASEEVDLNTPLTYVDRFRMRQPGFAWGAHPPHMDGGAIERWRDPRFRSCFESILNGDWKGYDSYSLKGRIGSVTSTPGQPNQASIFRTFQGWLAVSETAPNEGTLKVFPAVQLSTPYIILRPFFSCTVDPSDPNALDASNWKFDLSKPDFQGVSRDETAGIAGAARPFEFSPATHPHLDLNNAMISVPRVYPGDMVFWQADVVHAVEKEHNGPGDSSVMYIPAAPVCPQNTEYVARQAKLFEKGCPPPDFPQGRTELDYKLHAELGDIKSDLARRAMGLAA